LVSDRGDRCPFLFLFGRHLGIVIFPFPLIPAQSLVITLSIRAGAANQSHQYIGAENTQKIWKCDHWCCLFHHQSWGIVMLAAPAPVDRPINNYLTGVRGKENRIIPRWRQPVTDKKI
jgi:hypothetical protein